MIVNSVIITAFVAFDLQTLASQSAKGKATRNSMAVITTTIRNVRTPEIHRPESIRDSHVLNEPSYTTRYCFISKKLWATIIKSGTITRITQTTKNAGMTQFRENNLVYLARRPAIRLFWTLSDIWRAKNLPVRIPAQAGNAPGYGQFDRCELSVQEPLPLFFHSGRVRRRRFTKEGLLEFFVYLLLCPLEIINFFLSPAILLSKFYT